ncbi:hypothetical protein F4814DRAFT_417604 [Daldinia grandis]|nr:hypothetical protein F4814DRAFT_417604 [Daldinia grandis]
MKVSKCLALGVFSCLQGLSLASAQPQMFDNAICPWYYIRQNYHTSTDAYDIELIATCGVTVNFTIQYHTSLLNLDKCFVNNNGYLKLANPGTAPLEVFSKTCWSCGLMDIGPHDTTPDTSKPILVCQCKPEDPRIGRSLDASFEFDEGIWIDPSGAIGCLDHIADLVPYHNSSVPKMIPPDLLAPPTTVTTTFVQNNTLTSTAMVTNNATIVNTATATATATVTATTTVLSTANASCPPGSQATVTTTKKRKAKTVTATVTTTSVSTHVVTILVTPPPAGTVVATVMTETTARASFTTVYPRPRALDGAV